MSLEVQQYLNDSGGNFTETAPRPPVPGEENDVPSCGTSTSGSYRSHLSVKSHNSVKSAGSHRSDLSHHSPAATPRRSNLDKSSTLNTSVKGLGKDEVNAPLGFEPEGSAASSPPFTENSSGTPPYLKWAENLNYLLEDSDGVKLFKQFLDQEHCSNTLEFLFACRGLKLVQEADTAKIHSLSKLINRRYIKGDATNSLNLRLETKKAIADRLGKKEITQTIFDQARREVEKEMENDTYPLFIKSDLYVNYVSTGGESPKTSNASSGSNSVRPQSGPLPTLLEGEELRQEDINISKTSNNSSLPLTQLSLIATRTIRTGAYPEAGCCLLDNSTALTRRRNGSLPKHPYHSSYVPVSAQESEPSLSSDALTDDTMSQTDSSVDGREVKHFGRIAWKRDKKNMRRSASLNKSIDPDQHFIPRTERAPKDRNVAETDPPKFAKLLIDRLQIVLEEVLEEKEKKERMQESLKNIETTDDEDTKSRQSQHSKSTVSVGSILFALNASLADKTSEDNAQSILEDHCSRVFDGSVDQTPSRSPGRQSPDRSIVLPGARSFIARPSPNVSISLRNSSTHHKRKDKDNPNFTMSQLSFDSGMGEDKSETHHKHVHHYHHYHHVKEGKPYKQMDTPRRSESESHRRGLPFHNSDSGIRAHVDPVSGLEIWEEPQVSRSRSREVKKSSARKSSDSSSNIDSGVSVYDPAPQQVPNVRDPANDKVWQWIRENEKITTGSTTQYSTDGSGSSHKRSHKSQPSSSSASQSRTSKKPSVQYNANRSGSLDRSGFCHPFLAQDYNQSIQPSQPFMKDPSMPLLNPPNPTTQLEEARRRLEDETKAQAQAQVRMMKSKSFTGSSAKDKRSMPPPALLPVQSRNTSTSGSTKTIPQNISSGNLDLSGAEDYSFGTVKSDKSHAKKSASIPTTPTAKESIVVGYFFCGEPIPYRTTVPGKSITLGQFKALLNKRGNYKYFFKMADNDFGCGVVHEEIINDDSILPLWDGKVVGMVEKIDSK